MKRVVADASFQLDAFTLKIVLTFSGGDSMQAYKAWSDKIDRDVNPQMVESCKALCVALLMVHPMLLLELDR